MQVGAIETTLSADAGQFIRTMQQANQIFGHAARSIETNTSAMGHGFKKLGSQIADVQIVVGKFRHTFQRAMASIGAAYILPSIVSAGHRAIIGFNQQLDSATIAMESFLGSQKQAKVMLKTLQDFAARTPFNFRDLLGTSQQMLAMGVAADELLPRLRAIGDAAAAMGGSPEVLYRVQRALGQITAKGRVQAEELMQLAEVGIPAYEYIATLTGNDIPAALNKMRKGEIDAASAVRALLDGLTRDFDGMMEKQSKTMQGALSTVQDYVEMTVGSLGRPLFDALRNTMLTVADFLSSEEMTRGAAQFAENFAKGLKVLGEITGQVIKQIGPPLVEVLTAAYDGARAFFNGLNEMKAAAAPIIAVIVGLAGVVGALAKAITPLLRLFADNRTAAAVFSAALIALALRMKASSERSNNLAKALEGLGKSFKNGLANFKEAIAHHKQLAMMQNQGAAATQAAAAAQQAGASAIGAANAAMAAGTKAAVHTSITSMQAFKSYAIASLTAVGAALKSFLASTGILLAVAAAFTVVVKAIDAYKNRGKDAKERTQELSRALTENTQALLENKEALEAGETGAGMLGDTLLGTGEAAGKIKKAFGQLGLAAKATTFFEMADSFDSVATSILKAKGATEEEIGAIVSAVQAHDKSVRVLNQVRDAYLMAEQAGKSLGLTREEAQKYAGALEELQDQIENTDFKKVVKDQVDLLIGSGHVTTAQIAQAEANLKLDKSYQNVGEAAKAAMLQQEILLVVTEEYEAMLKMVDENAGAFAKSLGDGLAPALATTAEEAFNLRSAIESLIPLEDEAAVTAAQFAAATMQGRDAVAALDRGLFETTQTVNGFMQGVSELDGTTEALTASGWELYDIFFETSAALKNLGASTQEIIDAQIRTVDAFRESAAAAGYTNDQINQLIQSIGILDGMEAGIALLINMDTSQLESQIQALELVLGALGMSGLMTGSNEFMDLYNRLAGARQILAARRTTTPRSGAGIRAGIRPPEETGGRATQNAADEGARAAEEAARIAKQEFDRFITSTIDLGSMVVSKRFVQSLMGTPEDITAAFEELFDTARQAGLTEIPQIRSALQNMLGQRDVLIEYAKVRTALFEELGYAEEEYAAAQQRRMDIMRQANEFDKDFFSYTSFGIQIDQRQEALNNLMERITESQRLMSEAEREMSSLQGQRASYASSLTKSLTEGISTGRGGVLYQANRILEHARRFRDYLTELSSRGYPVDLIAQVAQLGAIEGGALARKLLSLSDADLTEFQRVYSEIQQVAAQGAEIAASVLFDADIATARNEFERQRGLVRQLYQQALVEANALAVAGQQRVDEIRSALETVNTAMYEHAHALQTEFANHITAFVNTFGPLETGLQSVFNEFLTQLASLVSGIAPGEGAIRPPAGGGATLPPGTTTPVVPVQPPAAPPVRGPALPQPVDQYQGYLNSLSPAARGALITALNQPRGMTDFFAWYATQAPATQRFLDWLGTTPDAARPGYLNMLRRAQGGMVRKGVPYLVGEKGMEAFVPGQYGSIISNDRFTGTMGGGGDSYYNIKVDVAGRGDGDEIGRQVVRAIQEFERRNGSKWRA